MATIPMPPPAANAALYDKTHKSGNRPSMIANIKELMTSLKGATRGGKTRRPGYGTRQAANIAGGGAAPSPMSIMPGAGQPGN
jgi:hypothetical protein